MRPSLQFCLSLLLLFGSFSSFAQVEEPDSIAPKPYVYVETIKGDSFEGFLIEQSPKEIVLITEDGLEIRIDMIRVQSMEFERIKTINESHYNLQASRYFFGPNALGMKRGEGYYQNNWIFLNQVSVGLSDRFTIGVGTVPLFIFGVGAPSPIWITPKFNMPIVPGKMSVAVGGLFGSVVGLDQNNTFGIGYGAFTIGDHDKNLNLSIGYGMADGEWSSTPTVSLSGMVRLSKKFYLISENYLVFDTFIASFGGRSIWSEVSLDYGFFTLPMEIDALMPWLGITVPFKLKA